MPHIVVVPFPAQGHINPCVTFANLLIPHGFTFTFVIPQHLAPSLPSPTNDPLEHPPIRYVPIPAISMEEAAPSHIPLFVRHLEVTRSMRPAFQHLLLSHSSEFSCVIGDCFVPWISDVSLTFNLPVFLLYTSNAQAMSAFLHIDELIAHGASPMSGIKIQPNSLTRYNWKKCASALDPQQNIDFIPGLLPIRAAELSQSIRTFPDFAVDVKKNAGKANGLIFNTVYELEQECLEVINQKVPVYAIGPMLLMSSGPSRKATVRDTVKPFSEDRQCLTWLDTKPPSSVLFVSFGSVANSSVGQLKELAHGLEASEQSFLWVIRLNAVGGHAPSSMLPDGFVARTKGRGLIISWAPQLEVLSHPSIGGFLTHCGWNSITENISMRCVPMLCWPQAAEQSLTARLLVDAWKVAVELKPGDGNMVRAVEIQSAVVGLMRGGDIRSELKKRMLGLEEVVAQSVQEEGSSRRHLRSLVQDLGQASQMPLSNGNMKDQNENLFK